MFHQLITNQDTVGWQKLFQGIDVLRVMPFPRPAPTVVLQQAKNHSTSRLLWTTLLHE
jgi:hypothetical protein